MVDFDSLIVGTNVYKVLDDEAFSSTQYHEIHEDLIDSWTVVLNKRAEPWITDSSNIEEDGDLYGYSTVSFVDFRVEDCDPEDFFYTRIDALRGTVNQRLAKVSAELESCIKWNEQIDRLMENNRAT